MFTIIRVLGDLRWYRAKAPSQAINASLPLCTLGTQQVDHVNTALLKTLSLLTTHST